MPKKRNEFAEMHEAMKRWVAKRGRAGWSSKAEERAAHRVQMSLWACANNDPIPPAILRAVAEAVLECAAVEMPPRLIEMAKAALGRTSGD
jgi:hypothetical protein